jgi:hypothetical protein
MHTLSLKVDENLAQLVEKTAKRRKLPKSELVRAVLREALEPAQKTAQPAKPALKPTSTSALARMKRYAGMYSGPGDLSTNKKHLEGYGK